jgi:hypothetical protein
MSWNRQILAALQHESGFRILPRRIAMSRRTENDSPIETRAPEVPEHRSPSTAEHPVVRERGDIDPSDLNPPAPPTPRAASGSDAGFGSFG